MTRQPTGTVTFLFTDIEGSTRLLQRLGETRYAEQLDRHRTIVRGSFASRGGYEVECKGDAFVVAFASAAEAAESAAEAQEELAGEPWPEGLQLRVRMGIHTGEPLVADGDYVGVDLHKAARIMASGHGGQVLVSDATRTLLDERFKLRDLGVHQLKDLRQPERLFQLLPGGEDVVFPRLRTLEGRPTNLPAPVSDFIGRGREVAEVVRLIRDERRRLVTLTGVGGVGKTRLAWRAAGDVVDDFRDGVIQVSLSSLRDDDLVLVEVARALEIEVEADTEPEVVLSAELVDRELLLLLDSFDRVRAAAPSVARLLEACPRLVVLSTSRVPLGIEAETVFTVPPLEPSEARDLLVSRAQAHGVVLERADPALTAIVDRVDRLPIALELAAARLRLLQPAELATKIEEAVFESGRLAFAPTRQQTIRSMIDWSYELMAEDEQRLFASMSLFASPAPFSSLAAVCAADLETLAALLDAGFVRRLESDDGLARFVLPGLVRAYARERLRLSGTEVELARAHANHYLVQAKQTLTAAPLIEDEQDQGNYWSALAWAREHDTLLATELAAALGELFRSRGQVHEERSVIASLATFQLEAVAPLEAAAPAEPASAEIDEGRRLLAEDNVEQALSTLEKSYQLARANEDPRRTVQAAVYLAYAELRAGRHPAALRSLLVALRLVEESDLWEWAPACFEGFAAIAAVVGEHVHAARMQGAAAAGSGEAAADDVRRPLSAETERLLVEQLGADGYRIARGAGGLLAPTDAAGQARAGHAPADATA